MRREQTKALEIITSLRDGMAGAEWHISIVLLSSSESFGDYNFSRCHQCDQKKIAKCL